MHLLALLMCDGRDLISGMNFLIIPSAFTSFKRGHYLDYVIASVGVGFSYFSLIEIASLMLFFVICSV